KDESGQNGYWRSAVETCGSVHVPSVVPFVQPGPVVLPAALSQPPAYHAQLTPASLIRSPMFRAVFVSLVAGCGAPKLPCGSHGGWSVLTAQSPQARPATVVGRSHAWVTLPSTEVWLAR